MPTDEQVREYADKLPDIYRHVLSAFPGAAPTRRAGDGLTADTLHDYIEEQFPDDRHNDVFDAVLKLTDRGFLTRQNKVIFSPTPLGERLIRAVTGHVPSPEGIPELPVPSWG
jgi:hypothetical protein